MVQRNGCQALGEEQVMNSVDTVLRTTFWASMIAAESFFSFSACD